MPGKAWNLLIDFDGTLHDTEAVFSSKLHGLFGLDGKTLYHIYLFDVHRKMVHEKYPEMHNDISFHCELLCHHLKKPINEEIVGLLEKRFKEAKKSILENPQFFKDTKDFLDRASIRGHRLCLSTGGGNSEIKAQIIKKFLGKNYFEMVLGEETVNALKDDPSYYIKALQRLSWEKEKVVSIGDSILTDVYPAKLVGIKAIWVNRKKEFCPLQISLTPDFTSEDLISVINYLECI